MQRRNRIIIILLAIALCLVFFAPVVPLQTQYVGQNEELLQPPALCHGPLKSCYLGMGTSIRRYASPSAALLGIGGVVYQDQDWLTCMNDSSGDCTPPVKQGYVLTMNCSDIVQYLH